MILTIQESMFSLDTFSGAAILTLLVTTLITLRSLSIIDIDKSSSERHEQMNQLLVIAFRKDKHFYSKEWYIRQPTYVMLCCIKISWQAMQPYPGINCMTNALRRQLNTEKQVAKEHCRNIVLHSSLRKKSLRLLESSVTICLPIVH